MCKAAVTVDSLIPLYTTGGDEQDPRLRGIPQRPTAERTPNSHSVANSGGAPVRTSAAGTAGPQPSGTQQQQSANTTAAQRASNIDGFTVTPLGVRYRIVTEGTGRWPTDTDRIKYDRIGWRDAFDGRDKVCEDRGAVWRVSSTGWWLREAMLSMREGEVRQIIVPAIYAVCYFQLRLIRIG